MELAQTDNKRWREQTESKVSCWMGLIIGHGLKRTRMKQQRENKWSESKSGRNPQRKRCPLLHTTSMEGLRFDLIRRTTQLSLDSHTNCWHECQNQNLGVINKMVCFCAFDTGEPWQLNQSIVCQGPQSCTIRKMFASDRLLTTWNQHTPVHKQKPSL